MKTTKNPRLAIALTNCFFCGEGDQLLIDKRPKFSDEPSAMERAAHGKVVNMEPCHKCADFMKQGIILITIDNAKSTPGWNKTAPGVMPDPYRAGGFIVIKEEAFKRLFNSSAHANSSARDFGLKHRWMFLEHAAAEMMGLLVAASQ